MILQVGDDVLSEFTADSDVFDAVLSKLITGPDILKAECDGRVIYYRKADRNDESIEFSTSLEFQGLHGTQLVNARTAYVVFPDGAKYIGGLHGSRRSGHGTMYSAEGDIRFKGEWKNDQMHGHGSYFWIDGHKYKGGWKDNKRHGHGTYTFADGSKYEGAWENDKKNGCGVEYYSNGNIRFKGQWRSSQKHGEGIFFWLDGGSYEGEWKNDQMHGYGTYIWPSGNIFPDGRRCEGEWKDNKLKGYCLETDDFGATFLHERNGSGQRIEPCTLVLNKNCHVGMWRGMWPVPYNHEEAMEIIKSAEESGPECVKRFCNVVRVYGPRCGSTLLSMF